MAEGDSAGPALVVVVFVGLLVLLAAAVLSSHTYYRAVAAWENGHEDCVVAAKDFLALDHCTRLAPRDNFTPTPNAHSHILYVLVRIALSS